MCLIVFSYQQHSNYDLILAANRDEEYQRPTRQAQFWDLDPAILAGKDLRANGTWMGINKQGHFSALTNFRDPNIQKEDPPSRGQLVYNFLSQKKPPKRYLQEVQKRAQEFMGFNLLAGTIDQLGYYSNQQNTIKLLDPGVYGLSNHLLDTPWPKVEKAKNRLQDVITNEHFARDQLFKLLQDDQPAPDDQIPNTGIPWEAEKQVSPLFIKSDKYGTCNSTVLLIDKNGEVTFEERRYKKGTMEVKERNRFGFKID